MKKYEGYLIDLDGTMYKGDNEIEGAAEFITFLKKKNIPYLFVTNNASLTPLEIVQKLQGFSIPAETKHVFSSAIATSLYLKGLNEKARCFVIGETGLIEAIEQAGLVNVEEDAEYVVMGLDRNITYQRLTKAALQIQQGAKLISTNKDKAIPKGRGLYPGNGAFTEVLTATTSIEPIHVGKPNTIIMNEAVKRLGVRKENILMIGDNYETDIQSGIQSNIDTLMVLTGVTNRKSLEKFDVKPTYCLNNLTEWFSK